MQVASSAIARQGFSWDWDGSEYVRVHRAVQRHARGFARAFVWVVAACAACGALLIVYWFASGRMEAAFGILPWVVILLLWLSLLWTWLPRASARAQLKFGAGPRHLIVDAEGVDAGSEAARTVIKWPLILRAVETPEFFLLFYNAQCAYWVPKRAMGGGAELEAFRNRLRNALGERARLSAGA